MSDIKTIVETGIFRCVRFSELKRRRVVYEILEDEKQLVLEVWNQYKDLV